MFKLKVGADGSVEQHKAWLVAQGFSQKFGCDYNETFSRVIRFESVRMMIALAVKNGLKLHQMDVTTAFLNGELEEEVYMKQPEGFVFKGQERLVCKLKRSIYGLKQSPRCWNSALDNYLKMGFIQAMSDPCLYIASEGEPFIIGIYVDDIPLVGKSDQRMAEVKKALAMQFEVKDVGELHYFLGMKIIQNRALEKFGLANQRMLRLSSRNLAWNTLNQSTHQYRDRYKAHESNRRLQWSRSKAIPVSSGQSIVPVDRYKTRYHIHSEQRSEVLCQNQPNLIGLLSNLSWGISKVLWILVYFTARIRRDNASDIQMQIGLETFMTENPPRATCSRSTEQQLSAGGARNRRVWHCLLQKMSIWHWQVQHKKHSGWDSLPPIWEMVQLERQRYSKTTSQPSVWQKTRDFMAVQSTLQ